MAKLKRFKLVVDDTITFQRKWNITVQAADLEAAKEQAIEMAIAGELGEPDSEEEIDNAPYGANEA